MKRYERLVLKTEIGTAIEVLEKTNGELVIRAANVYSEDYQNPPIPNGYKHVCGKWNNGFVIERYSDRSQFVWIPVGSLAPNGTLDSKIFSEKFFMTISLNDEFSAGQFNMNSNDVLYRQFESIKKYGGFYISRYHISKRNKGLPVSIKNSMPWIRIGAIHADEIAASIENSAEVESHLPFIAEYDLIKAWLIKTKVRTPYIDEEYLDKRHTWDVVNTGRKLECCANNIYDIVSNMQEWVKKKDGGLIYFWANFRKYENEGYSPVSFNYDHFEYCHNVAIGFRASLYIK